MEPHESCATWLVGTMSHVVELNDGTNVLIRPLLYSDREALAEGFHAVSEDTRRQRFISPRDDLTEEELEYLTNIDYDRHFAWAAFDLDAPHQPGIAVGRYVCNADDATTAEVAVTVRDEYQHRGLGTLLVRMLGEVALHHGVRKFVNYVQWDSPAVIEQLRAEGARVVADEPGLARVEIDLPASDDNDVHTPFWDGLRSLIGTIFRHVRWREVAGMH